MEPSRVITQVLERKLPKGFDFFCAWLEAKGQRLQPGESIENPMPLVQWIARGSEGPIGLLHWPTPDEKVEAQVVCGHGTRLELLATSVEQWIRLELAREELGGGVCPAGLENSGVSYQWGEASASALPYPIWCILKGGGTLGAYQMLLQKHLVKGDRVAALVSAERAAGRFPGWGEPHAWRYDLLVQSGALQEASDAATAAMGLPIWTLREAFETLASAIGWSAPIDSAPYRRLAADSERPPADRAAHLMDAIAVERGQWAPITTELASLYEEAGLKAYAAFVKTNATD